jgi:hypothetical protein
MNPEELEKQRQQEADIKKAYRNKLTLQAGLAVGAGLLTQLPAVDRINKSVLDKVESLKGKVLSQILPMADNLGIKGIETGNPQLPDLCPSQEILDRVYNIRQALGDDINNVLLYADIINKSLNILTSLINGQINTLTALNTLKTSSALASQFIPTPPPGTPDPLGVFTSLLSSLDDVRTVITFEQDGNPKLPKIKRSLEIGTKNIQLASQSLLKIVTLLSFIDKVLDKCGKKINPIENDLLKLANEGNNSVLESSYKGFIFEIVEKPFNQTLNQKVAVAKNSQGIILLQSEPSFTDNPQVLINELKLVIDRDNLKAD